MKYLFQQMPLSEEKDRNPSQNCHPKEERSGKFGILELYTNCLTTLSEEARKNFLGVCEDESLTEYLDYFAPRKEIT